MGQLEYQRRAEKTEPRADYSNSKYGMMEAARKSAQTESKAPCGCSAICKKLQHLTKTVSYVDKELLWIWQATNQAPFQDSGGEHVSQIFEKETRRFYHCPERRVSCDA